MRAQTLTVSMLQAVDSARVMEQAHADAMARLGELSALILLGGGELGPEVFMSLSGVTVILPHLVEARRVEGAGKFWRESGESGESGE